VATLPDGREPIVRGHLVYLRPGERDDVPLFVRWFNDRRTMANLAQHGPLGLAQEERWFEAMLERQGRDAWFFVICLLDDDRPIGTAGLFALDLTNGSAGFGIAIGDPGDRGRGYGTDATDAIVAFGFDWLRLERIWLDVYPDNPAGLRSYEKAGFVHEATLREAHYRRGAYLDALRMAIVREDWEARRTDAG
jgi:RimJ/RimL family protein N-acetyltransferase